MNRSAVPGDQEEAVRRAQQAIASGRAAEAERLAAAVLARKPGHIGATKALGYAFIMLGRSKEAIAVLERTARRTRDAEIETQLAIALRHAGRNEDALLWLDRATKRTPPFPAAFHELGMALKALRRHRESIEAFQKGLALAPMMTEMALQLGHAYYDANDRIGARAVFERAHMMNPSHPGVLHALGAVLLDDHDYVRAAELYRGALAVDPSDTTARINLGACLLALGQPDVAYACLRAATARGPQAYAKALKTVVTSPRGRLWLRPSAAAKFLRGDKS